MTNSAISPTHGMWKYQVTRIVPLLSVLFSLFASPFFGGTPHTGTQSPVTDETRGVIPGTKITATNVTRGISKQLTSAAQENPVFVTPICTHNNPTQTLCNTLGMNNICHSNRGRMLIRQAL
jgi:hypothetical protein